MSIVWKNRTENSKNCSVKDSYKRSYSKRNPQSICTHTYSDFLVITTEGGFPSFYLMKEIDRLPKIYILERHGREMRKWNGLQREFDGNTCKLPRKKIRGINETFLRGSITSRTEGCSAETWAENIFSPLLLASGVPSALIVQSMWKKINRTQIQITYIWLCISLERKWEGKQSYCIT